MKVNCSIILILFVTLLVCSMAASASDYLITDCQDLQDMQLDPSGNYELQGDIDCSDTINWDSGAGFQPIANFTGQLNGAGFVIRDFFINRPSTDSQGLFGHNAGYSQDLNVIIQDIGMENVNITCGVYCGAIAGWNEGYLLRSYATGSITGTYTAHIGGLVGVNQGVVNNSWANISFCGYQLKGGIISDNIYVVENTYFIGGYGDIGVCDLGNDRGGICGGYQGGALAQGHSYFASDLTGSTRSYCPEDTLTQTPSNSTEMKKRALYSGWDFANTWQMCDRDRPPVYPSLQVFGLCCQASWVCDRFTACGNYHQDCISAKDINCGYHFNASLDGDLAQFGRNCSINANSPDISLQNFDLRYAGNLALFALILGLWIVCLSLYIFTGNYGFAGGAILLGIFLFILTFRQIHWVFALLFPIISITTIIFLHRED